MEQTLQYRIVLHVKVILVPCLMKVLQFTYVAISVSYQSTKDFQNLMTQSSHIPLIVVEIEYSHFKVKTLVYITEESENN